MRTIVIIITLALFVFMGGAAYAAPQGASTSFGNSTTGNGSTSTTVVIEAGNLSYVNVSTIAITDKWAGFFGEVSGNFQLADSGGNVFYQWSVSNVTDVVVYAANETITDWSGGNIEAANYTHIPDFLKTNSADNYTNTFGSIEEFNSTSLAVANTSYTVTYQSGSPGPLRTYALYSPADTALILAGKAIDSVTGFDGTAVDYQIIVPANTTTTYYFYMELP